MSDVRPLAIAVVMVGVVLLALGTWLILRASFGSPRKQRPAPPAPRPGPQVADRPRTAIAFPPAAVARTSAPPEEALWQRPALEAPSAGDGAVTAAVHEPAAAAEMPDEPAEEPAPFDLPAGAAAWGAPVPPEDEPTPAAADVADQPPAPAAAEAPAEEAPAEEAPAEEAPAEEASAEEASAEEAPAEEASAEEAPAEEASAEEASAEEAPAEEPAAVPATDEAPTPDEAGAAPAAAAAETPPVEPTGETPAEAADQTPAAETPAAETPAAETPAAETPAAETPAAETPADGAAAAGPAAAAGAAGAAAGAAAAAAGWAARREPDDAPQVAPRSSFAESLAAQADESHEPPRPTPPVPRGDAVMPMGTVLGGSAAYPPLPPPQTPLPPPAPPPPQTPQTPLPPQTPPQTPLPPPAPPAEQQADPLQDWAQERPAPQGHQLGPVVGQQGPLPDLGATPPGDEPDDDWAARFGALAEQLGEPPAGARPDGPSEPAPDQQWPSRPDPDESPTTDFSTGPLPREPDDWSRPAPQQPPARRDEPFGRPYGQPPGPPPPHRAAGPEPAWPREQGPQPARPWEQGPEPARPREQAPETPRAASRQAGTRSRRGRPEDPRQAAVYDALTINEQVLDEVWTSPSVDVLKVVSSIVVNALDAYEDDPAEYADWVAVHRTGNCDCH